MVDGESQDIVSEPTGGAPSTYGSRPEDGVIEGDAASEAARDAEAESRARAESAAPPPPPPRPRVAGKAFAAGAAGGAVVAALATAAGLYLFPLNAGSSGGDASGLASLQSAESRDGAAIADLGKRLAAIEGANTAAALATLDKRVGAIEASGPPANAAASAAQPAQSEAPAAETSDAALAARVAKLESAAAPAASAAPADLSALSGRLDKLESALAAPKAETRAAPEKAPAGGNTEAIAVVAAALRDKLAAGAAFPTELAALSALGVDPANLAPLKALPGAPPTDHALATAFKAIEPKILAAAAPKEHGGVGERFLAHLRGLIQIHKLGETEGDDPQALVSQIEASLERGDLDAAMAAFAKLPEPAKQAAAAWSDAAQGKEAAEVAARTIREAAVARLAQGGKP